MSEDFNDNKTIQAQSSEAISGGGSGIATDADYVRPAEVADQDLYHGHSFITKWIFCQDAKVIGVQYTLTAVFTGVVGLILSNSKTIVILVIVFLSLSNEIYITNPI